MKFINGWLIFIAGLLLLWDYLKSTKSIIIMFYILVEIIKIALNFFFVHLDNKMEIILIQLAIYLLLIKLNKNLVIQISNTHLLLLIMK